MTTSQQKAADVRINWVFVGLGLTILTPFLAWLFPAVPRWTAWLGVVLGALVILIGACAWMKHHWQYASGLLGVAVLFFLAGYLLHASSNAATATKPGPQCISTWGGPHQTPTGLALQVVADGNCVLDFVKSRNDYYVSAVALHSYGLIDFFSEPVTAKGRPHDIQPSITIMIPILPAFTNQPPAPGGTSYVLLAVPRKISMDQFSTLNEAATLGVLLVGLNTGPP